MNKTSLLLLFLISTLCACCQSDGDSKYPRWVGDIKLNPEIDDSTFKICNARTAKQYHNFGKGLPYEDEKIAIKETFKKYDDSNVPKESGLLRIRFIVNCNGETGAFRVKGMDENYEPKDFDDAIINQLLDITKSLDKWKVMSENGKAYDYYQYLIFKINNGALIEIMP